MVYPLIQRGEGTQPLSMPIVEGFYPLNKTLIIRWFLDFVFFIRTLFVDTQIDQGVLSWCYLTIQEQ